MTQVKEMTNQQLNKALAELMGYTVIQGDKLFRLCKEGNGYGGFRLSEDRAWTDAPDYCTDPAASLEVQAAACNERFYWYIQVLSKIVGADGYWDRGALDYEGIALLLTATPRERAEAAYITLLS